MAILVTVPILFALLPESIAFLVSRQPRHASGRPNRVLRRVGIEPLSSLPAIEHSRRPPLRETVAGLFSKPLRRPTCLVWASFFLVMFGFYFVMSWTPRLLVSAGLSNQHGITGGVLLNVGGIVGTSLTGPAKGLAFRLREAFYRNNLGPAATFRSDNETRVNIDYTYRFW